MCAAPSPLRPPRPGRRVRRSTGPGALAVWLALLGALSLGSGSVQAAGSGTYDDPPGDTFGLLERQHDIRRLAVESDGESLLVEIRLAAPVSRWDSGETQALTGIIDLDTDQNPTSGGVSAVDSFAPEPSGLGAEMSILLGDPGDPSAPARLVDLLSGRIVGEPEVTFGLTSVLIRLPLAWLEDDGELNAAAVVGTLDEPTDATPDGGSLASGDQALRLLGYRFRVEVAWRDHTGGTGRGHAVPHRSATTGLFWFFSPDNWELEIKVLDGCGINERYWVFAAATTDVEYEITVEDTASGETRSYVSPLGQASVAITDTGAFATCP